MKLIVSATLTLGVLIACQPSGQTGTRQPTSSSVKAPASSGTGDAQSKTFSIFPPKLVSGYDGTHTFQAPAIAVNGSQVKWSVDDPSVLSIEASADGSQVMFTTKKAGKAVITAQSGSQKVSVNMTVNSYTAAQWANGDKRYNNAAASGAACSGCHAAKSGDVPDHTPTEIDADTDDEVSGTFINGVDPEGRPVNGGKHKFALTADEKAGIMVYLRSLKPSGYPEVDPDQKAE